MITQQHSARTRDRCLSPTCRDRLTGPPENARSFGMGRAPAPRHTTNSGGTPKRWEQPQLPKPQCQQPCTWDVLTYGGLSALSSSGAFPSSLSTSCFSPSQQSQSCSQWYRQSGKPLKAPAEIKISELFLIINIPKHSPANCSSNTNMHSPSAPSSLVHCFSFCLRSVTRTWQKPDTSGSGGPCGFQGLFSITRSIL